MNLTQSIAVKFNLIAVIFITVIFILFGTYDYLSTKSSLENNLQSRANQSVERLKLNLPGALWNLRTSQLEKTLVSELAAEYIKEIVIYDDDALTKFNSGKTKLDSGEIVGIKPSATKLKGDYLLKDKLVFTDEFDESQSVGVVVINIDKRPLESTLSDLLFRLVFQTLILDIVVVLLLTSLCKIIVIRPISRVTEALGTMAKGEGDLTQRLSVDGGEIGQLSENFNLFIANIQSLIKQIIENMNDLSDMSIKLSENASSTSECVEKQKIETDQVATATLEMSTTSEEINRSAKSASSVASEGDSNVVTAQEVISATSNSVRDLAGDIEKGSEAIGKVKNDVNGIATVLDVIGSIADQTNLLALNAAIEAARAGEQGRGFAVVADEVRTLAKRTQDSTSEVYNMLSLLQNGADSAVSVIQSGEQQSHKTVSEAEAASESLNLVTENMSNISAMNYQISSAVEEQVAVVNMISQSMTTILSLAEVTASEANNTKVIADDMTNTCRDVRSLIDNFKV
jgi:methyl-accepting chemotaxis protein